MPSDADIALDQLIQHILARIDSLERANELTLARLDSLERTMAEIRALLRQPRGATVRVAPDGTIAIRDPDIIAQQQRTGTRGYASFTDTE